MKLYTCIGAVVIVAITGVLVRDYGQRCEQQSKRDAILQEAAAAKQRTDEYVSLGKNLNNRRGKYLQAAVGFVAVVYDRNATESRINQAIRELLDADAALEKVEQMKPRFDQLRNELGISDNSQLTAAEKDLERQVSSVRHEMAKLTASPAAGK